MFCCMGEPDVVFTDSSRSSLWVSVAGRASRVSFAAWDPEAQHAENQTGEKFLERKLRDRRELRVMRMHAWGGGREASHEEFGVKGSHTAGELPTFGMCVSSKCWNVLGGFPCFGECSRIPRCLRSYLTWSKLPKRGYQVRICLLWLDHQVKRIPPKMKDEQQQLKRSLPNQHLCKQP